MKLSFSTKGWHNSSFQEFCDIAKDLKFKGIELHNIHNELFTAKDGAFYDYTAAATVRKLYEQKLCIPCIDTIYSPTVPEENAQSIEEINACIEIADNLHIPYVRLKARGNAGTEEQTEIMVETIKSVLPAATEKGIVLLVETSGIYADTAVLCDLLDRFGICIHRFSLRMSNPKLQLKTWVLILNTFILRTLLKLREI